MGVANVADGLNAAQLNVNVTNRRMPFTQGAFESGRDVVTTATTHIRPFMSGDGHFIETPRVLWGPAEIGARSEPGENGVPPPRGILRQMAHLGSHVVYIDGRPPSEVVNREGDLPIVEVAVPAERASEQFLNVSVGDVLEVSPGQAEFGRVLAVVTGAFEPVDLRAPFWAGLGEEILAPSPAETDRPSPLPMFLRGDAIWRITEGGPISVGTGRWLVYLDQEALASTLTADVIEGITAFQEDVERAIPRAPVSTGPKSAYESLERRSVFAQAPTYLMGALLVSVAVYYLLLVSSMLAERRTQDIGMLRSRGVSTRQLGVLYSLEALPLIGLPVVMGPFVAMAILSQLGKIGAYRDITGGGALPVELSWAPFAWSTAGGLVALAVLIVPALTRARGNIVAEKQASARPARPPVIQRYFFDLGILALGGLILWELGTQRTIVIADESGRQSADLSALFGPVMILLAAALLFLRLFPWLMKTGSAVLGRVGPVWAAMGFWRLSRNPYQYAWAILLLVLASGLGVLAATLASTLERSSEERIAYATASDFHVRDVAVEGGSDGQTMGELRAIPGVQDAAIALETRGSFGTTGGGHAFQVFAVDPQAYGDIVWFRDDFASRDLPSLLKSVYVPGRAEPLRLEGQPRRISAWAKADPPTENLFLWVVLRDGEDRLITLTLGPIQGPDWARQAAEFDERGTPPFRLDSILVFQPSSDDGGAITTVQIDDLTVDFEAGGQARSQVLVPFESVEDWTVLPTSEGLDSKFSTAGEPSALGPHAGRSVGELRLGRGTDSGVRGIYRSLGTEAIPVVADRRFMAATETAPGMTFVARVLGVFTPFRIVSTATYFPPLDPDRGGFLVADYAALTDFFRFRGEYVPADSQQVYFDVADDRSEDGIVRRVREVAGVDPLSPVVDRERLRVQALIDPLAVAGWRGMAVVTIAGTLAIVAAGYATYLSQYFRRAEMEAAFLKVLGLSRRAFFGLVALEHVTVGVVGLLIGTVAGLAMAQIAVDSVAHTEAGGKLLPPFVLTTEWAPVALIFAGIGLVALFLVGNMLRAFGRLALSRFARMGE